MNVSIETLTAKLQNELGADAVELDPQVLSSHSVDGKVPTVACFPSTAAQIGRALVVCSEAQAATIPWGGGTAIAFGNIPRSVDVVLALENLNKLIEHDDANLTATVQAGMRLSALQEQLNQRNQFLAVDAPRPDRATIGGTVAANINGPRRILYGSVRDLVIGMKMVLATGEQIKAGGKVVKNVAGYDLCKLFVGSLGTLGIITEVTFKMTPLPEAAATLIAQGPLDNCTKMAEEVFSSTLLPAAITLFNGTAAKAEGFETEAAAVAVWTEGFVETVERHAIDIQAIAQRIGLAVELLRDRQHSSFWQQICNFGAGREIALYRLTVPLGSLRPVLLQLEQWSAANQPAEILAHAGSATIFVQPNAAAHGIGWLSKLTEIAKEHHGYVVVMTAPSTLKKDLDVWGPAPPSLEIMREIKHKFDPQAILNPGRFISGI
ncbi:MAG: FAD-binding oxidoreductase [Candidatus Binatia bacterium]